MKVKFKKLRDNAKVPQYMTEGAAGMDLYCLNGYTLYPGKVAPFETGLAIEVPPGFEAQVRPRSSLACKSGVTVANSPGTIDSDYRGEIVVFLKNTSDDQVTIFGGDRIAQLVIAPIVQAEIEVVEELSGTARGTGGFGHTGR